MATYGEAAYFARATYGEAAYAGYVPYDSRQQNPFASWSFEANETPPLAAVELAGVEELHHPSLCYR